MEMKLVVGMWGPCGEPTAIVHGMVRGGVIENRGETGNGRGYRETRGGGRVGLFGAIAGAEVLAHLLKSEPALGDIGRA